LALLEALSDNFLKQAQFNAVISQIDENGPGGIEPTTPQSNAKIY
jgi:hypothetical protein